MPTSKQIESIAVSRLEEICSWGFQASLRFGKGNYQTCLGALDNVIKVSREAKTLINNIKKDREGKKQKFLKTIKKTSKRKTGLKGISKTKKKANGKSKRTPKRTASGNKKKSRKVR